jgi:hypothetical protein
MRRPELANDPRSLKAILAGLRQVAERAKPRETPGADPDSDAEHASAA